MIVNNFHSVGQLVVDTRDNSINSIELLARPNKNSNTVNIEAFFANVETISLTRWFSKQLQLALDLYNKTGIEIHINIDKRTLDEHESELHDFLIDWVGGRPLTLEITQLHGLPSPEKVSRLRVNDNIKIALDDFVFMNDNVQNSLHEYNFDIIKLDKAIVTECMYSYETLNKIKALHQMFNVEFIVEGVETYDQYMMLQDLGFYLFQGYYFHTPETIDQLYKRSSDN